MFTKTTSESIKPKLQLLTDEQINLVHSLSKKILMETGIKVESKKALKIFEESNGVKVKNDMVYIQDELIEHAVKKAPANIEIFKRDGNTAFNLSNKQEGETYFGIGVTNTYFQDIESSTVKEFTREHMRHCTKLGDLLNNYDMVSTLGVPSDAAAGKIDLYSTLDMYANTIKPLVLLFSESENINQVFELLTFLHGDISDKPFCIPYFNPITPLILNASTTDKMIAAINNNLPLMYSNYSMYGATTPFKGGGTLALLNAELIAGLVFCQLIKEGTPVILGSLPAAFNMRTSGTCYTPQSYLLNLACAEMMSFYEIPHCGTSGSSNGWGPDLLASGDLWQNHLTSCIGKVGCAPFVGGNFDSMAFSPSTVILSNHIIGEAKKFAKGFLLNNETVNVADINEVGAGGNYLTSEQTLASLSNLQTEQNIWPSLNMNLWKQQDMPKADKYLIDYSKDLYNKAIKVSKENIDVIKKGAEFISNTFK